MFFPIKPRIPFVALMLFMGSVSTLSAVPLRIIVKNAGGTGTETVSTTVRETIEGKEKISVVQIGGKGDVKRGLALDLDKLSTKGDLKQLEFEFPGAQKGAKQSVLLTFSKAIIKADKVSQLTKVSVRKMTPTQEIVREFSYYPKNPGETPPCQAGADPFATHHHLIVEIQPQAKDVTLQEVYEQECK